MLLLLFRCFHYSDVFIQIPIVYTLNCCLVCFNLFQCKKCMCAWIDVKHNLNGKPCGVTHKWRHTNLDFFWPALPSTSPLCHTKMDILPTTLYIVSQMYWLTTSPYLCDVIYECPCFRQQVVYLGSKLDRLNMNTIRVSK